MSPITYPGVYIEEIPCAVHQIPGVFTPVAVFVGWAPQGPLHHATLVRSWREFETQFLGPAPPGNLGNAVHQFFVNGGQQLYIVRTFGLVTSPTRANLPASVQQALINIPLHRKSR